MITCPECETIYLTDEQIPRCTSCKILFDWTETCRDCGRVFDSEEQLLEHQFYHSTKTGDFVK